MWAVRSGWTSRASGGFQRATKATIRLTALRENARGNGNRPPCQQVKARFLRTSAPTSIDGIEKYLASGMIRRIGPLYAKRMVKAVGAKVFDEPS
jgi:DNA-binding Lrp family transcriptional regulator